MNELDMLLEPASVVLEELRVQAKDGDLVLLRRVFAARRRELMAALVDTLLGGRECARDSRNGVLIQALGLRYKAVLRCSWAAEPALRLLEEV
jgi:hypothetical protein